MLVHWLGFTAVDRTYEPVENLLDNANIYLRTAIKTYLRTAVESDPSLAQLIRHAPRAKPQKLRSEGYSTTAQEEPEATGIDRWPSLSLMHFPALHSSAWGGVPVLGTQGSTHPISTASITPLGQPL